VHRIDVCTGLTASVHKNDRIPSQFLPFSARR